MIYIVRHGQTEYTLQNRYNGGTDNDLTPTGIEQAKAQAENLRGIHFDAVFSSPLKRTKQTCEIIYKGKIIFDDRLVEINCGELEGAHKTPEVIKAFGQAMITGTRGVESLKDFVKRNCDFCDMVVKGYKGNNVLIVAHDASMQAFNYYFAGMPKDYDFTKNAIHVPTGGLITFDN